MNKKRLTKDQKKTITELYLSNTKVDKIAENLSLSTSVIYKYLRSINLIEIKKQKQVKTIINMTKKDFSKETICKHLNLSQRQIYYILRQNKIRSPFKKEQQKKLESEVIKSYNEHPVSINVMSNLFNCNPGTIRKIYYKYNLPLIYKDNANLPRLTSESKNQLIQDLKKTTMTCEEIGQKYGISRQMVSRIKIKHDITRPTKKR